MKYKLSEEEFGKLPQDFQSEYEANDDGEYILKVEGGEDTGALKRAKDHEKKRRKDAEEKVRELESQVTEIQSQLDDAKEGGSSARERQLQKELDKVTKERDELNSSLGGQLDEILLDGVADKMSAELTDSPKLMRPHILSRLAVEVENGKRVTRVKDVDGEISAMTLDELKSEFQSNDEFASIIRGSEASGSGAQGGKGGNGGGSVEKPDFSKASPKEIAEYLKTQKEA